MIRIALIALAALVASAVPAVAQEGRVCPDPAHPCGAFAAYDLPFVLPRDGVARAEVRSEAFWAVILRSAPKCSIGERERMAAQARFPGRKVFVPHFECEEDGENNVTYSGVRADVAWVAVYAGRTRAEAAAVLRRAAATGAFPGAYLRRMRAVYVYP